MTVFEISTQKNVYISTHTPLARRDGMGGTGGPRPRRFLLTRLSQGVTETSLLCVHDGPISTHTPLARRDNLLLIDWELKFYISTHTPLARRDPFIRNDWLLYIISTHTPLARRDLSLSLPTGRMGISTHTPLARRD